jgi:hypothetical protein
VARVVLLGLVAHQVHVAQLARLAQPRHVGQHGEVVERLAGDGELALLRVGLDGQQRDTFAGRRLDGAEQLVPRQRELVHHLLGGAQVLGQRRVDARIGHPAAAARCRRGRRGAFDVVAQRGRAQQRVDRQHAADEQQHPHAEGHAAAAGGEVEVEALLAGCANRASAGSARRVAGGFSAR